jgi:hypothetical protein
MDSENHNLFDKKPISLGKKVQKNKTIKGDGGIEK